jgi:prolipoprotein diacylglyceryltransferase
LSYGVACYLSWRYFRGSSVIKDIDVRWYYYTVLVAGFVIGSVGLSMLNNYLSLDRQVILGKSILGALFGGILFSEIFKYFMSIKGSTGAYFVPSLAIGIAIGRIGCFLAGLEDYTYGIETTLPWGVDFGDGLSRHPVQLYESGAMFVFFGYSLWRYRVDRAGFERTIFYQFILWYASQRFVWELLKPYESIALGINLFGWVCLLLIGYAILFLYKEKPIKKEQ